MGIWRFAGAFAVAQRQSECGSKNLQIARQPANANRRVLGVRSFFVKVDSIEHRFNSCQPTLNFIS